MQVAETGKILPALCALLVVACGPSAVAPASQPSTSQAGGNAAPAASTQALQPSVTVRLATKGAPSEAALALALKRGYWERQGLNIESVAADSGPQMVPALATNQLQVGAGAMSASLFNALNRGVNIRMVADFSHVGSASDTTLALLVRKDLLDSGAVKSLADLKGRTVGMGTAQGTVSDFLFYRALEKAGLTGMSVDTQYLPFPDILTALANKKLDAGTLTEPLVTSATQKEVAKVLIPAGAAIEGSELSVLQFSPQFAAEKPEAATRFLIGYLQGVRDYYDAFVLKKGRAEAIDLLVKELSEKDPRVWETSGPAFADLNGNVNLDDLRAQGAFYKQQGTIQGEVPDVAKYVDTRFSEAAVKEIGAR